MDIYKTLEEYGRTMIIEDLDFYTTELETGDYSISYIRRCKELLSALRMYHLTNNRIEIRLKDIDNLNEYLNIHIGESKYKDIIEIIINAIKNKLTNVAMNVVDDLDLDYIILEIKESSSNKMYIENCENVIEYIKNWDKNNKNEDVEKDKFNNVVMPITQLLDGDVKLTSLEKLKYDLNNIRSRKDYKKVFKKYISSLDFIDSDFIDKNYGVFQSWEINAIVSTIELKEEFLEKYFGAIDHDKVARYQYFSESFFMKHFSQLDYSIVLEKGKNEWRKKEKRSKQLDVFLRLKGVKI